MIYKLIFESKSDWEHVKLNLYDNELPLFNMAQPVVLGTLYEQPSWDPETEEKPDKVALPGFHVDIKSYEPIPSLDPYKIEVNNPQHNFA